MKPIKLEDDSGVKELLDESAVDEDGDDNTQEDEGEDEEGQKYLFYDIEARQEDGRHIVWKNSVNGCWTERTKERFLYSKGHATLRWSTTAG